MEPDGVNRRHSDGAGNYILQLQHVRVQGIVDLNNSFAVIVDYLTFGGEPESLSAALNQPRLENVLQRDDLLADGGLRDPVQLGRFGELFSFDRITIDFQAVNIHKEI
jgi:hypothetical protein